MSSQTPSLSTYFLKHSQINKVNRFRKSNQHCPEVLLCSPINCEPMCPFAHPLSILHPLTPLFPSSLGISVWQALHRAECFKAVSVTELITHQSLCVLVLQRHHKTFDGGSGLILLHGIPWELWKLEHIKKKNYTRTQQQLHSCYLILV